MSILERIRPSVCAVRLIASVQADFKAKLWFSPPAIIATSVKSTGTSHAPSPSQPQASTVPSAFKANPW